MSGIDVYNATRNLIENAFSYLTWHKTVCEQTGFKGISQVWIEDPAWYFWLEHVTGAFLLRLHADEPIVDNQYVSLSLHYFPTTEETAYQDLSIEEKRLLSDESFFDQETNTPNFEGYDRFIHLFVVAEVGFVIDSDHQLQVLLYSSEPTVDHSVCEFIDLLICALNFQSKQHHQKVFLLQDGLMNTLFLSYSEPAFQQFIDEFELDSGLFELNVSNRRLDKWLQAAHINAVCSMNGACSCSH